MRPLFAALTVAAAVLAVAAASPASAAAALKTTGSGGYVPVDQTRVLDGATIGGHGTHNVQVTDVAGVPDTGIGAVAMTISVTQAGEDGQLVAFAAGATRPSTVNVQFGPGRRTSDLAVVVPGAGGKVSLYNNSGAVIRVYVDVSGYYVAGATSTIKSYHPVKATRLLDDLSIGANGHADPVLGGRGPLPGSMIGAVAVTITERSASKYGALAAKAYHLPITGEKVLYWKAGQRVSSFAIVPVDADGQVTLTNYSTGSVHVAVDVVGYFLQGAPYRQGMLDNVPAANVFSHRLMHADGTQHPLISARVGVPFANVRAVVLTVTVASEPTTSGSVLVWPDEAPRPDAASLQFGPNEAASTTVIVPLSESSAKADVHNNANGPIHLTIDVTGWVLDDDLNVPQTSVGRYVRNLERGDKSANASRMKSEGKADAGSPLVLLDIGAQRNDKSGVQLSGTDDENHHIDYAGLVDALSAYVDAYAAADGAGEILVGTSNSAADWTHYTGTQRGRDWWFKVVKLIHHPAGVSVVGASDIEPGFGTGQASDALAWKHAYQGPGQTRPFVFNGSADDCPVNFDRPNGTCLNGWRESDLVDLAGGENTQALPQIYNSRQAIQWTNIFQTEPVSVDFLGALTEFQVDGSYSAAQGWAALHNGLTTIVASVVIPRVVALHVDD